MGKKTRIIDLGGVKWCYENWDTKWNACESVIEEDSEYEYEGVNNGSDKTLCEGSRG